MMKPAEKLAQLSSKDEFERAIDVVFSEGKTDEGELGDGYAGLYFSEKTAKLIEWSVNAYLRWAISILPIKQLSYGQQSCDKHNSERDSDGHCYSITFHNPAQVIRRWFSQCFERVQCNFAKLTVKKHKKSCKKVNNYNTDANLTTNDTYCPTWVLIWFIFMIYVIALCLYLFRLQWQLHSYYESWHPLVRERANHTEKCALKQDIYLKSRENYEMLVAQRVLIYKFGLLTSASELFIPIYISASIYSFISFMLAYMFVVFRGLDFTNPVEQFLIDPSGVRRKYALKASKTLRNVYQELKKCRLRKKQIYSQANYDSHHLKDYQKILAIINLLSKQISSKTNYNPEIMDGLSRRDLIISRDHSSESDANSHYDYVIDTKPTSLESYAMPACFRLAFREVYLWNRFVGIANVIPAWFGIGIIGMVLIMYLEVHSKLGDRQTLLECQKWHPNATIIKESTFTLEFDEPISDAHKAALLDYKNNKLRYFLYEVWHQTFWIGNLIWMQINFPTWYIGVWMSFNVCWIGDGILMKVTWTRQVITQLENCIIALKALASIKSLVEFELDSIPHWRSTRTSSSTSQLDESLLNHKNQDRNYTSRVIQSNSLPSISREIELILADKIRSEKMESALIITFCNFELLRQARKSYKNMNEYFSSCCLVALVSLTMLIYTIFHKLGSTGSIFVFAIILLTLGLSNNYFLMCVIVTQRHQRIHYLINEIIGHIERIPGDRFKPISRIFQRNLMLNSEVQSHYSTSFLGTELTRSALISLNSYALGGLIFLFLSRNRPD